MRKVVKRGGDLSFLIFNITGSVNVREWCKNGFVMQCLATSA